MGSHRKPDYGGSCRLHADKTDLTYCRGNRRRGLTLFELLAVVALLAVLVVLVFPNVAALVDRARDARCINNMRLTGAALLSMAWERQNGAIWTATGGAGAGSGLWGYLLLSSGYLAETDAMYCPAISPHTRSEAKSAWAWRTFGLNQAMIQGLGRPVAAPGFHTDRFDPLREPDLHSLFGGDRVRIQLSQLENPSKVWLLADSRGEEFPLFRIRRRGPASNGLLHLRHRDKAHVLFADGHLESVGLDDARRLEIVEAIDRTGVVVTVPP